MLAKKPSAAAKRARGAVTGKILLNTAKDNAQSSTVIFGAVSVNAVSPKVGELRRNINTGQAALSRAASKIVKPGVTVKSVAAVPLFRADPRDPSRLIREVNGKVSTGRFVDGKFKVLGTKR
jgi:hypothetical protein